jgi:perilipin-2
VIDSCFPLSLSFRDLKVNSFVDLISDDGGKFQLFSIILIKLVLLFLDYNPMFNWAFRTTENVVKGAVTFSAPIVNKFDAPINFVDQTFVKGLDKLEEKVPVIKEQPAEILNQAKAKVMDVVQPQINKVCSLRKSGERKAASLKELSYNKAKEVLATSYGSVAVSGIDSTAVLAERLLDSFFPKTEEDDVDDVNSTLNILTHNSHVD